MCDLEPFFRDSVTYIEILIYVKFLINVFLGASVHTYLA